MIPAPGRPRLLGLESTRRTARRAVARSAKTAPVTAIRLRLPRHIGRLIRSSTCRWLGGPLRRRPKLSAVSIGRNCLIMDGFTETPPLVSRRRALRISASRAAVRRSRMPRLASGLRRYPVHAPISVARSLHCIRAAPKLLAWTCPARRQGRLARRHAAIRSLLRYSLHIPLLLRKRNALLRLRWHAIMREEVRIAGLRESRRVHGPIAHPQTLAARCQRNASSD